MRPVLILGLLVAGCVQNPEPEAAPSVPASGCIGGGTFPDRFYYVGFDTTVFRQGERIAIAPRANIAPAGIRDLPLECTSGWTIAGPATLAPDRRSISIAADASPGAEVRVAFRLGSQEVASAFRVVARDAVVLTGARRQTALQGCEGPGPVGELEFSPNDRFSVTFQPFETYRDYWGSYSFDPATGRLIMTVEGGNFVPPGLDLDGTARLLPDGHLVLEGIFLGSRQSMPQPGSVCRYTF